VKDFYLLAIVLALCGSGVSAQPLAAQTKPAAAQVMRAAAQPGVPSNQDMERALQSMDAAAARFKSAQASITRESYELVVNERTQESGEFYIRKTADGIEMAAHMNLPQEKYVVFAGKDVRVFQPKINQVAVYEAGKNRDAVESFLLLGFGGSGHKLAEQYDVKPGGTEKVDEFDTIKLELTPKSPRVKNLFAHIELWIDPKLGFSRQQKLTDPSGNYQIATYHNIKQDVRIPDKAFELKTNGKTQTIYPR
jgi:outer membrane lipoprotein-sorting protein